MNQIELMLNDLTCTQLQIINTINQIPNEPFSLKFKKIQATNAAIANSIAICKLKVEIQHNEMQQQQVDIAEDMAINFKNKF